MVTTARGTSSNLKRWQHGFPVSGALPHLPTQDDLNIPGPLDPVMIQRPLGPVQRGTHWMSTNPVVMGAPLERMPSVVGFDPGRSMNKAYARTVPCTKLTSLA